MSNRSLNLIERVAAVVPNSEVVRGMLILRPTRHIVRGFKFEHTSRHAEFYMWSLIVPLFTPFPESLSLNYSKRISITEVAEDPIIIAANGIEKQVKSIQALLLEREIPHWAHLESPAEFVNGFAPRGNLLRPNVALELAIAKCLADDIDAGMRGLNEVLNWKIDTPILAQVKSAAHEVIQAFTKGTASFNALISVFESRNADKNFKGITRA